MLLWKLRFVYLFRLEKTTAPHSSTLAWKIPWTEEPGGLQSMRSLSQTLLSNFTFTFHFHVLEKEIVSHSSVLAWRIPGMAELGGLLSMGLHRVGHDWCDLVAAAAVGLLDNMTAWFFIFRGTSILFSVVAAPIYSIIYILLEFPFLYIPSNICYLCLCLCTQSCPILCYPIYCSLPGSSVHRLLWAKILEWVAISFSRGSLQPNDRTQVSCISCIGRWVLYQLSYWGSPCYLQTF